MGLLRFLFKPKPTPPNTNFQPESDQSSTDNDLKIRLDSLQSQVYTLHIALSAHHQRLDHHDRAIQRQSETIESLEQKVAATQSSGHQSTEQPMNALADRIPTRASSSARPVALEAAQRSGNLELSRFSPQEKRILSVFFNNRQMQLSYADIAQSVGKSPHTVKNQLRQIRMKADIFTQSIATEGRKRFQLKDSLQIQNYLKTD